MIDAWATMPHYLDHIAPVWLALPDDARGTFVVARHLLARAEAMGIEATTHPAGRGPCIVAGYRDLYRARKAGAGPFVLMQHGAGQSYGGDPRTAANPAYAGGKGNDDVALFLVPGPHPARRWAEAYPGARIVQVGNIKPLPDHDGSSPDQQVVAVSFHWPLAIVPEMGSAWRTFRAALPDLDERWRVIGTGHPRWFAETLAPWYHANGIQPVPDLADVARMADVLVADNTSALFEFAATGRPVVVINDPAYRRDVQHGLRFWEAATVGIQVDDPSALRGAVRLALLDPTGLRDERARCVAMVYAGGGVPAAVEAILTM